MAGSTSDVHDIFTSIAGKYDVLNSVLSFNADKKWRKKAIELCGLKEGHKLLDLCCGTGQMIEYAFRSAGKSIEAIGLDLTEDMIEVGYKRLNRSIRGYNFSLIRGNAETLPFDDNSFDCVTIAFGLRNVPDKKKALSEMYRVLKPGGRAVCLELSKPQAPVWRNIYNVYFNHVLPLIGHIGTGDKKAYKYLRDSVNGFMSKPELKLAFDRAGYRDTGYVSLTLGVAAIHYGTKQ